MSAEDDQILSDADLAALAQIFSVPDDYGHFDRWAELTRSYADQAESLFVTSLANGDAPSTIFQTAPPDSSGPVSFSYIDVPATDRPVAADDLAFMGVAELAALLRSGAVSPVELADLYLGRLDGTGRELNSVVTLTPDLAMRQAREAEAEIGRGDWRGPLHGVPWGAKDLLASKGIPTTWGSSAHRSQVIDQDAAVVERLERAGAVLCAKLSMGSLAYGPNWFGGMTRNPWNTEKGSSGSSAGPGAATAAGLIGFSIGTETHGSITSPSHTCGVTGLRPTFGRVSRHGAMALGYSLDKIGPMCRSAEDCAAVLSEIAGRDDRDPATVDAAFTWPPTGEVSGLRIGYVEKEFDGVEGAATDVDREALDVLRSLGATVEPVEIPRFPKGMLLILWVEAASAFDELARTDDLDLLEEDNSQWPKIFRAARTIPATAYVRAQRIRGRLMAEFARTMGGWDAIACPATGDASLTLGNLTGNPSLTFPVGFPDRMPRGMTLIGRLWDEETILSIGHAFQAVTDWHRRRPPIGAS